MENSMEILVWFVAHDFYLEINGIGFETVMSK